MNDYLLMDGTQIPVLSELAQVVGLNEAIVLQEVYYWCKVNKREKRPTHDGYYWVYNSYTDWTENHFPWWSYDTVRGIFKKLEKQGLLIAGNFNKSKMDRTRWYRINFPVLSATIESSPSVKNSQMDMGGITRPIPEIIPESNDNGFTPETAKTSLVYESADIDKFIAWYFANYLEVFGTRHPNIRADQRQRIKTTLQRFADSECADIDLLQEMAHSFIRNVSSNDWHISHFATDGILKNQYYEVIYHGR